MRKLTLYTAASLDGFIAGPNGEIDWLEIPGAPEAEDYGYSAFFESIGTTLQGSTTYELAASHDDDAYPGKTNYVFTRKSPPPHDSEHWRFVTGDIAGFVRELKEEPGQDIWLVGGGQINTVMLEAGLIDEMIVTLFPLVLGEGIPLFAPGARKTGFRSISSQSYETGLVQWTMARE